MTEPIIVIAQILSHEMNLTQDRIFIYNDVRELPKDEGMYLVLEVQSRPPYVNKSETKIINGVLNEVQSMNVRETIIVHCVSKNAESRKRSYEVQMAMSSNYAQQAMEENKLHIGRIAPVLDASSLEGTSRLNRFDCTINLLAAYEQIKPVEVYDSFSFESWMASEDNVQVAKFEKQ